MLPTKRQLLLSVHAFFPPSTYFFYLLLGYLLECGTYFNLLPTCVCYLLQGNLECGYMLFSTTFIFYLVFGYLLECNLEYGQVGETC